MAKRKTLENRLDRGDLGLAATWGLRVEVYPVERRDPAPWFLREDVRTDGTPVYPWASEPGGVFLRRGYGTNPAPATRTYDAVGEADRLLIAVTKLKVDDEGEVLGFVNRWGLLGCSTPRFAAADSFLETVVTLRRAKQLAHWLSAMQNGRWRNKAIPGLEEMMALAGVPPRSQWSRLPRGTERQRLAWSTFALSLNGYLQDAHIRPALVAWGARPQLVFGKPGWVPPGDGTFRVRPVFSVSRLVDLLFLNLWRHVSDGRTVLRPCRGCSALFSVPATDRRRRYCNDMCKNNRNYRWWYSKPENRRRRNEQRRQARVARQSSQ